jgi:hypothetical protein
MAKKNNFPNESWQWPFYIFGWLNIFSLLFWLVQVIVYLVKHRNEDFFNEDFHKIVFYFGLVELILLGVFLILAILALLILGSVFFWR